MSEEFEQWWIDDNNTLIKNPSICTHYELAKLAWNHQQAKLDAQAEALAALRGFAEALKIKMSQKKKYEIATALANNLAESYILSNIADMMIAGSREKAKSIRALSDSNADQNNRAVQEYRAAQRTIYSAVWDLLDGRCGYRLVKTPHKTADGSRLE